MAEIIDGKAIALEVRREVKKQVAELVERTGITPKLCVILVGDDPASQIYVANKQKACEKAGIIGETLRFGAEMTEGELVAVVERLNADKTVNGILVQLPLPKHINEKRIIAAIAPEKDVDGLNPMNTGLLFSGRQGLVPCTPAGCIELLKRSGVQMCGANAVIIGRSKLVGMPLIALLLNENCTVTVCHTKTADLAAHTREADIIVSAAGAPGVLTGDMVKPGAVVIDVGIVRKADSKITGDADFESVAAVASKITPVPGGVGPMTIAMLIKNTYLAAEAQNA